MQLSGNSRIFQTKTNYEATISRKMQDLGTKKSLISWLPFRKEKTRDLDAKKSAGLGHQEVRVRDIVIIVQERTNRDLDAKKSAGLGHQEVCVRDIVIIVQEGKNAGFGRQEVRRTWTPRSPRPRYRHYCPRKNKCEIWTPRSPWYRDNHPGKKKREIWTPRSPWYLQIRPGTTKTRDLDTNKSVISSKHMRIFMSKN